MEQFTARRIADLAEQADRMGHFTFTDFLGAAEYAEYLSIRPHLPPCGVTVSGGKEAAERVMLRFGDPESLGYEVPFPIAVVQITPRAEKFAEALTHRDVLGAVMHLGIERSVTGDILFDGKTAYLLCKEEMADFICRELTTVRHTAVRCEIADALPEGLGTKTEPVSVQIPSERTDAVIAKQYRLSRSEVLTLFAAKKVCLNGAVTERSSDVLKEGDTVSVRGYGKFRYAGLTGKTRKGNLIAELYVFV